MFKTRTELLDYLRQNESTLVWRKVDLAWQYIANVTSEHCVVLTGLGREPEPRFIELSLRRLDADGVITGREPEDRFNVRELSFEDADKLRAVWQWAIHNSRDHTPDEVARAWPGFARTSERHAQM